MKFCLIDRKFEDDLIENWIWRIIR